MDAILTPVVALLPVYGPWLVFLLAILETCFVTGLVVPSGLATSVATVLALEGVLSLPAVIVAALAGGAVGDSVGFWIGRRSGPRLLSGQSRLMRSAAARHDALSGFFGRHPIYSVTLARLVAFVRSLMPMAAGISDLSYRRYLVFEGLGLAAWASLYVGIGLLAGESWRAATRIVGVGGSVIFLTVGVGFWVVLRRRAPVPAPLTPQAEDTGC
jgi:membrane protein DedA with SNARE-associated domain